MPRHSPYALFRLNSLLLYLLLLEIFGFFAWASQIIVMGCKLKDLFVLIIHCCLSVLVFTKIDEIVFYPILVRKNLLFFKITSLSQLYNYLFVSYTYSVFNEHFHQLNLICWCGGDDGDSRSNSLARITTQKRFRFWRLRTKPPSSIMRRASHFVRTYVPWWRWWDSNPWPPACRAGALPAELHPHN